MKTLEGIIDYELSINPEIMGFTRLEKEVVISIAIRYAKAMIQKAADNAKVDYTEWKYNNHLRVDKNTILNTELD